MGHGIDGDLSACCDNGPHDPLGAILRKRIKDGRGLAVIALWLPAGILDGQEMGDPDQGRPHGSVLSPLWANVDLHAVLATWVATVVQAHCRGQGVLYRSADDVLMGCEVAEDARRIKDVLPHRCAKYGLESNAEQTKLVECRRPQRPAAGRKPGTCSLLGFVPSWGKTWRGGYTIERKTEGKRLRRPLGEFWRWCRDNRHRPLQGQDATRGAKRRGDDPYEGVRCQSPCLDLVSYAARRAGRYWLNRRGGRKMTWRACGRTMAA